MGPMKIWPEVMEIMKNQPDLKEIRKNQIFHQVKVNYHLDLMVKKVNNL